MPLIAKNTDLPVSWQVPGVYAMLSYLGSAPSADNNNVLFLGYKTSAGSAQDDVPVPITGEQDAVDFAGKGSDLHRMYRAYMSQPTAAGSQIYFCPVKTPSGTAQTRIIKIMAAPVAGVLGVNTTASAAGLVTLRICGYEFSTVVAQGDSFNTIAANLKAEIDIYADFLPCTAGVSTDTITLTMRHAAVTSQDLPIEWAVSNAQMAVAASPGIVTLANNTDGVGANAHTLLVATQSNAYTTPNPAETANTSAAAWIAQINAAASFPVTAAQTAPSAVIRLFFVQDRVFNRPSVSTTDTSQTVTPTWGTAGAGTPNLTNSLANLSSDTTYWVWLTNLIDTTTLGTLASHIETRGNGLNCRGQRVVFCDTQRLATSGAILSATTPALTSTPRFRACWCPASPQQAYELAARVAARIMGEQFKPRNYAGAVLSTSNGVPLRLPHSAVIPSDTDVNSAMVTYNLSPLRQDRNRNLTIVAGRTTAEPSATIDRLFAFWGVIDSLDWMRDDVRAYASNMMAAPGGAGGKALKIHGIPRGNDVLSPEAVTLMLVQRLIYWDGLDLLDGAEDLVKLAQSAVNPSNPARIDAKLPVRPLAPFEQLSLIMQVTP